MRGIEYHAVTAAQRCTDCPEPATRFRRCTACRIRRATAEAKRRERKAHERVVASLRGAR